MRLKQCHHHGFTVLDLENSLRFYRDFLELELVRVSERKDLPSYDQIIGHADIHLHVALLRHPDGTLLELFQNQNPKGRSRPLDNTFVGASHMAFEVEDIDAVFSEMTASGFESINPPVDVERDGTVVARAMYALDPDGISLELFQEYSDLVAR